MDKKTPWYTRMTDDNWATAIKIAAVLVAMPRWIGALLEADGVPLMLTPDTAPWWGLFSALASAGMALVEGVAFWYTLRAWRKYGGGWLFTLIVASMATFAMVLTPYIMANVSGIKLANILQGFWIVAWSSCVSLSTILIVASVGYAQPKEAKQATLPDVSQTFTGTQTANNVPQAAIDATTATEVSETPLESVGGQKTMNHTQPADDATLTHSDAILSIDDLLSTVPVTGNTAVDVLSCYAVAPNASQDAVASHIGKSRGRVGQVLAELAAQKRIERNGQVKVLAE